MFLRVSLDAVIHQVTVALNEVVRDLALAMPGGIPVYSSISLHKHRKKRLCKSFFGMCLFSPQYFSLDLLFFSVQGLFNRDDSMLKYRKSKVNNHLQGIRLTSKSLRIHYIRYELKSRKKQTLVHWIILHLTHLSHTLEGNCMLKVIWNQLCQMSLDGRYW